MLTTTRTTPRAMAINIITNTIEDRDQQFLARAKRNDGLASSSRWPPRFDLCAKRVKHTLHVKKLSDHKGMQGNLYDRSWS